MFWLQFQGILGYFFSSVVSIEYQHLFHRHNQHSQQKDQYFEKEAARCQKTLPNFLKLLWRCRAIYRRFSIRSHIGLRLGVPKWIGKGILTAVWRSFWCTGGIYWNVQTLVLEDLSKFKHLRTDLLSFTYQLGNGPRTFDTLSQVTGYLNYSVSIYRPYISK